MQRPLAPWRRTAAVSLAVLTVIVTGALLVLSTDRGDERTITVANRGGDDPELPVDLPSSSSTTRSPGITSPTQPPLTSTTHLPRPNSSSTSTSRSLATQPSVPDTGYPEGGVTTTTTAPCAPPPFGARTLSAPGIYFVPLSEGLPRRFAPGSLDPYNIVASPDGKRIVFMANDPSGVGIYAINDDGSGLTRLRTDAGRFGEPSWSPDGRWIAFHQRGDSTAGDSIWVMAPDGTQERRLFQFPLSDGAPWAPRWSPDSSQLAVMGSRPEPGVWVIDVASGTNRRLLSDQVWTVAWSPGSDRLVVDAWGPTTSNPDGTTSIPTSVVVINADGTDRRDMRRGNVGTWSPSGDIVLLSRWVISDTGEERPYTFKGLARTFAPDGQHLVTEDGATVFVYDRSWCGRPLVTVEGPYDHSFEWAGPARLLVRVHRAS